MKILSNHPHPLPELESDVDVLEITDQEHKLIVYNDDVNTFDHVIECLMEICGHDEIQATQCTYIIHFKGKCCVKTGTYNKLVKMRQKLVKQELSAEVE